MRILIRLARHDTQVSVGEHETAFNHVNEVVPCGLKKGAEQVSGTISGPVNEGSCSV